MYYLCIAKRREPADTGFSPLFLCENGLKKGFFYKAFRKIYMPKRKFSLRERIFAWLSW